MVLKNIHIDEDRTGERVSDISRLL